MPEFKKNDRKLVKWYEEELREKGVRVFLNSKIKKENTALHLAKMGKEVTILEVSKEILEGGRSLPFMNYDMLKDLLNFYKVSIKVESSLEEVKERSIVYKNKEGKLEEIENDTLVLAVGYKPKRKLYDELKMEFSDIYLLGDAREVHNIMYAIWDAYEVARSI